MTAGWSGKKKTIWCWREHFLVLLLQRSDLSNLSNTVLKTEFHLCDKTCIKVSFRHPQPSSGTDKLLLFLTAETVSPNTVPVEK